MARLTRKNIKVFAGNATNNGVFGSLQAENPVTTTNVEQIQSLPAWNVGWDSATMTSEKLPPLEEFQGIQYVTTYQQAYLMQEGMPEWASTVTYYKGSLAKEVTSNGFRIYYSLTNDNTNNLFSDTSNWKKIMDSDDLYAFDNSVVHKEGAETITGTKTFEVNGASTDAFFIKNKAIDLGTFPSNNIHTRIYFKDKNGDNAACIYSNVASSGENGLHLQATKNDGNNNSRTSMGLVYPASGNPYAYCPNPTVTTTTNSTQIATAGWVNSTGNNVVHLTDAETIAGTKTFTGIIYDTIASDSTRTATIRARNNRFTLGTAPASNISTQIQFRDSQDAFVGDLRYSYDSDGAVYVSMVCEKQDGSVSRGISVGFNSSGTVYTSAPTCELANSIVTTVNKTKSSNGYYQFGNGLIIQWGKTSNLGNNPLSPISTTLPKAFTSTNYKVVLTIDNGTDAANEYGAYVVSKSTTAFTAIIRGFEGGNLNRPAAFIAIGY